MSDRPHYEFVDTNVFVYAHDRSAGEKHEAARLLLQRLWQARNGCLSLQVLQEFYVTVTRKVSNPLTPDAAAELLRELSVWRVHTPTLSDLFDAVSLQQRYGISLWDSMVIQSAARLGCAVLWSEDLNAGQEYAGVRVQNPFAGQGLRVTSD